jgi:hypothetical protein
VAARAASLSPYLSLPRSQLRVGRNCAENRAPELEIKRAPASSAVGPARRRCPRRRALPAGHPGRLISGERPRLNRGVTPWPGPHGPVDHVHHPVHSRASRPSADRRPRSPQAPESNFLYRSIPGLRCHFAQKPLQFSNISCRSSHQ